MHPWLSNMNPEQAAVIAHTDGPLYVAAVAGCGKTRALVNRIARLVHDGAQPDRILAVTFSRDGAGEMNARLGKMGVDATISTWHALAWRILREDCTTQAGWKLDDKNRHKTLVKEACGYKYLDWKDADTNAVRSYIGWCKAQFVAHDDPRALEIALDKFGDDRAARLARSAYQTSDELVHGMGLLTFDDMLVFAARHLSNPDNAARWAARWDYVMQDEAQDASPVQMVIAEALARGHRNYMIVGDPAQSIYGFRGSSPEQFQAFPATWGADTIYMHRNYRSGSAVIKAANGAIAPALVRLPVEMAAERPSAGMARSLRTEDLDDEANEFLQYVQERVGAGGRYSDCTVLFRTNAQSRALEDALIRAKVPYVVVGGGCFYERKEVKDLLAYLRVAADRDADGDAVRRCINAPFRFLGRAFVDRLMVAQRQTQDPDWPSIVEQVAQQQRIQSRQASSARQWASIIRSVDLECSAGEALRQVVAATGYTDWVTRDEGEETIENSGATNVRELLRVADSFASVEALLDYVDKNIAEQARQRKMKKGDHVLLMTIHKSKGLEWPCVWMVGCNDGILPHAKGDPEEERRLFYVAATRAQDELTCSYVNTVAGNGGRPRELPPSKFLANAGI